MSTRVSEDEMKIYYQEHFPIDAIKKWLSYGDKNLIARRECAFWFNDTIFKRWETIDFFNQVKKGDTSIERMEIGPVYTHPIRERAAQSPGTFFPNMRELVFDLDADDFKDNKCCCGDSQICEKCWPYMQNALKIITFIMIDKFGFKHILPVFSGRRGVHVWVLDEKARNLEGLVREKIVQYMNLPVVVDKDKIKANPLSKDPTIVDLCDGCFAQVIKNQRIFNDSKASGTARRVLGEQLYNEIKRTGANLSWDQIKNTKFAKQGKPFKETEHYKKLIISYTFPRLDAHVTTGMNHLLKSPFSVHPKSGLLSVPFPDDIFNFPNDWVPSMHDLITGNKAAQDMFDKCVARLKATAKNARKAK